MWELGLCLTLLMDLSSSCIIDLGVMFGLVWFVVFNATFNNISAISWQSVLLVKETGVPEKKH
jgi:hypothetical protein